MVLDNPLGIFLEALVNFKIIGFDKNILFVCENCQLDPSQIMANTLFLLFNDLKKLTKTR